MRALFVLACIAWSVCATAAEVSGIKLDDKIRIAPNAPELVLNGAGTRTRFFVNVYVGGLYLTEKKNSPGDAISLAGPKRVSMTMLRDLTAQQLSEALHDGFKVNNAAADLDRYKAQLDELSEIMNSIGQAKKGDSIALDYLPDSGTRIVVNGAQKGKPLAGEGFYRGLLRIWLGDRPVDGDLKRAMLGQS
jgi:hypothetical protein